MSEQESDARDVLDEFDLKQIDLLWMLARFAWAFAVVVLLGFVIVAAIRGSDQAAVHDPYSRYSSDSQAHSIRRVVCGLSVVSLIAAYAVRKSAVNPRSRIHRFMGSYNRCVESVAALCSLVGMGGLMDFFVHGDYLWFIAFMVVSVVALFLVRPRKQDLINLAIQSKRAS